MRYTTEPQNSRAHRRQDLCPTRAILSSIICVNNTERYVNVAQMTFRRAVEPCRQVVVQRACRTRSFFETSKPNRQNDNWACVHLNVLRSSSLNDERCPFRMILADSRAVAPEKGDLRLQARVLYFRFNITMPCTPWLKVTTQEGGKACYVKLQHAISNCGSNPAAHIGRAIARPQCTMPF